MKGSTEHGFQTRRSSRFRCQQTPRTTMCMQTLVSSVRLRLLGFWKAGSTSRKAVSRLGKTTPFLVTPKAKVNSVYYCKEVLARGLLPNIRQLSGVDGFTFQQDGAPAHRSRERRQDVHYLHWNHAVYQYNIWHISRVDNYLQSDILYIYFQCIIWACGIGDKAMKLTPLERAAQILQNAARTVLETCVVL